MVGGRVWGSDDNAWHLGDTGPMALDLRTDNECNTLHKAWTLSVLATYLVHVEIYTQINSREDILVPNRGVAF